MWSEIVRRVLPGLPFIRTSRDVVSCSVVSVMGPVYSPWAAAAAPGVPVEEAREAGLRQAWSFLPRFLCKKPQLKF